MTHFTSTCILALALSATTASAQFVCNDTRLNAYRITRLPFVASDIDTTIARAPTANEPLGSCMGRQPVLYSVWFRYKAPKRLLLEANTFGSNFDTALVVFEGAPEEEQDIACSDDSAKNRQSQVFFTAQEGATYWFLVGTSADQFPGLLTFRLRQPAIGLQEEDLADNESLISIPH